MRPAAARVQNFRQPPVSQEQEMQMLLAVAVVKMDLRRLPVTTPAVSTIVSVQTRTVPRERIRYCAARPEAGWRSWSTRGHRRRTGRAQTEESNENRTNR